MATEPKKPAGTAKPAATAKPAGTAKAAGRATKPARPAADGAALESRLSKLESGLEAVEQRLGQRAAALEARMGTLEKSGTSTPRVNLPAGVPDSVRQFVDRAVDLVRHNPITALILIVAFLLIAIFS